VKEFESTDETFRRHKSVMLRRPDPFHFRENVALPDYSFFPMYKKEKQGITDTIQCFSVLLWKL